MCLINAAYEHFITQTGKKPKTALKNFIEPGGRGAESRGPRAEKNKYLLVHKEKRCLDSRANLFYQFEDWFYEERNIKSKTNHKQNLYKLMKYRVNTTYFVKP